MSKLFIPLQTFIGYRRMSESCNLNQFPEVSFRMPRASTASARYLLALSSDAKDCVNRIQGLEILWNTHGLRLFCLPSFLIISTFVGPIWLHSYGSKPHDPACKASHRTIQHRLIWAALVLAGAFTSLTCITPTVVFVRATCRRTMFLDKALCLNGALLSFPSAHMSLGAFRASTAENPAAHIVPLPTYKNSR